MRMHCIVYILSRVEVHLHIGCYICDMSLSGVAFYRVFSLAMHRRPYWPGHISDECVCSSFAKAHILMPLAKWMCPWLHIWLSFTAEH